MYYVYLTTDNKHDVKYIGQHKTNHTEIKDMLNDRYFGKGARIKELIKDHGKSIFSKEILEVCKDKEEAEFWELFYIDQYDAIESDDFYNVKRTTSTGMTQEYANNMSELKKEYHKNNPGKQSQDMKAWYSNKRNRDKHLLAVAKRYGHKNIVDLIEHRGERKLMHTYFYKKYPRWFMGKLQYTIRLHISGEWNKEKCNDFMSTASNCKRKYPELNISQRTAKQWEIPEIREKTIESMKGPRLKTRGMRGNKAGELSYIDQVFYDLKEHPRNMGGWADAFIIRYRHRSYRTVEGAIEAITRQCNRIKSCGYDIDIQEALKWYLC